MESKRNSNLELFRIITMILIVAHHYVVNSGLTDADGPIYSNMMSSHSIFLLLIGAWGKTGINCFVMITGFFMCKSDISFRKFAKLFFEWMFYRIVIGLLFWIFGFEPFTVKELVRTIIPITSIGTNFTESFIIFFLTIPYLNILVNNITEKQHKYLIALCSFSYIILGTFRVINFNYISWFIVLFIIASYIRLYPKGIYTSRRIWGTAFVITVMISIISIVACAWLASKGKTAMPYMFMQDSNTFLAFSNGLCGFMYFKNIKIKYNKVINLFGASTFGVFLIHSNSDTMRRLLWVKLFNNVEAYNYSWLYIHAIGAIIAVYLVCSIIDICRIKIIEKPFLDWIEGKYHEFIKKTKLSIR